MPNIGFAPFCLYFTFAHKVDEQRLVKDRTLFLAHRGLTEHHLENTQSALLAAFENSADGVEFDVQLSKDLIPVVFHDDSLKRLCGIDKNIYELTSSQLSKIRQKAPAYKEDYPIATLEEILPKLPSGKLINIEIKNSALLKKAQNIKRVLDVIAPHKYRLSIVLSSFDIDILRLIAKEKNGYPLGLLLDQNPPPIIFLRALPLVPHLSYLNPHLSLLKGFHQKLLSELATPLIVWGHKKMGTEGPVVDAHHYALISDITNDLVHAYI